MAQFTLNKNQRLKSRKAIEALFKQGKSFSVFPFRVVYTLQEAEANIAEPILAGFSVSTRYFKRAVKRNRIKRLMREAYRLQKLPLLQKMPANKSLHLFFIYVHSEVPIFDVCFKKMSLTLSKLEAIVDEKN